MQGGLAPVPFGLAQPLPLAYGQLDGMALPQMTQMPVMPGLPTALSTLPLTTPSIAAPALGGQMQVLLNQFGQPMQTMQTMQLMQPLQQTAMMPTAQPAVIAPTVIPTTQPTMLPTAQPVAMQAPPPPPPPAMQPGILQAQGLLQANPLLAQQYLLASAVQPQTFEQTAQAFDNAVASTPEPEVTELAEHFKLDERMVKDLDSHMKRRKDTIEDDIKALYEILEGARNPAGLLRVKLREMEEGTFRGTATPDRDVEDLARKFSLDAQAAAKLAEVLSKREDRKKDVRQLQKHLELSNKPSSLVMMFLKDLRNGISIKDPEYPAAVGSYAHKRGMKRPPGGSRRSRSRSKSRKRRRRSSSSSSSPPSEFLRRQAAKAAGEDGEPSASVGKQASEEGAPRAMTLLERFG